MKNDHEELNDTKVMTKKVALIACFASCYAVSCFWPLSPILGAAGKSITVATIMAPVIGIILDIHQSVPAVTLGGIVGFFLGSFNRSSFASGVASTFFAGFLQKKKRLLTIAIYSVLLVVFAFYPAVGPGWQYPLFLWLQVLGLIILVSPLQPKPIENPADTEKYQKLAFKVGVTCFVATLFGHIAGCLTFEALYLPTRTLWQTLTWVYPVERLLITIAAMLIGTSLIKVVETQKIL